MKVLQVNCVYKKGSTGKITHNIHTELQKLGIKSIVCYGRGEESNDPDVYKTCGELYSKFNNLLTRFTGIMYGGCFFSTNRLISIIKKEKPDVVHLHCINGYFVNIYRLVQWLKENHIRTVLTLHAEFIHTGNCGHAFDCEKWKTGCGNCPRFRKETKSLFLDGTARSWKRMKVAFEGFEEECTVVSVSPWLMERAKQSPILSRFPHRVILNGIDTKIFYPRDGEYLRERYGLKGKKLVLHVTAVFSLEPDHIKGGRYVAELAKRIPEVTFVVIGSQEKVPGLPENILNLGRVENQEVLADWYSAADVTLLTSKRETFSMVVAESLCCGTPVVGFKAGGPESIALPEYSQFVEYGDIDGLEAALDAGGAAAEMPDPEYAHNKYSRNSVTNQYIQIYKTKE